MSSHGTTARLTRPGISAARAHCPQEMWTPSFSAEATASGLPAMAVMNMALVITLTWAAVNVR